MPTWVSELYQRLATAENQQERVLKDNTLLIEALSTWKFNPTALHRLSFLLPPIKPLVLMTHLNNSTSAETSLSINVPESENITKPSYSQIASSPPRALIKTSRKAVARTFIVENKERISSIRSKFHKLGLQSSRHLNIYYPDSQVIGILLHNDYRPIVEARFKL
ncbi:hypothetical protein BDB01DRAFT_854908 [Pilobolus umbonatus]|nr:hypothetical protein BDB01DRAFT_854908 [Pilobolus umbonatus]